MSLRDAAQQALEFLRTRRLGAEAHITALEAALAEPQPQPEPVAWRYKPMVGSPWSISDDGYYISCKRDKGYIIEPLYTTPPQRQPDEVERLRAERDALLAVLKEAVECDGGDDGLFHACCGESFWTAHDVKCWVPKARAAIDAARGKT